MEELTFSFILTSLSSVLCHTTSVLWVNNTLRCLCSIHKLFTEVLSLQGTIWDSLRVTKVNLIYCVCKCLCEIRQEKTSKGNDQNLCCWECEQRNLRGKVRSLYQLISKREDLCKRQYLRWTLTDGHWKEGV